jgi:hypothetical protein
MVVGQSKKGRCLNVVEMAHDNIDGRVEVLDAKGV